MKSFFFQWGPLLECIVFLLIYICFSFIYRGSFFKQARRCSWKDIGYTFIVIAIGQILFAPLSWCWFYCFFWLPVTADMFLLVLGIGNKQGLLRRGRSLASAGEIPNTEDNRTIEMPQPTAVTDVVTDTVIEMKPLESGDLGYSLREEKNGVKEKSISSVENPENEEEYGDDEDLHANSISGDRTIEELEEEDVSTYWKFSKKFSFYGAHLALLFILICQLSDFFRCTSSLLPIPSTIHSDLEGAIDFIAVPPYGAICTFPLLNIEIEQTQDSWIKGEWAKKGVYHGWHITGQIPKIYSGVELKYSFCCFITYCNNNDVLIYNRNIPYTGETHQKDVDFPFLLWLIGGAQIVLIYLLTICEKRVAALRTEDDL